LNSGIKSLKVILFVVPSVTTPTYKYKGLHIVWIQIITFQTVVSGKGELFPPAPHPHMSCIQLADTGAVGSKAREAFYCSNWEFVDYNPIRVT